MKLLQLTCIFIGIFVLKVGCTTTRNSAYSQNTLKQKLEIQKIELTEQTRGSNILHTVTPTSVTTSNNGVITKRIITKANWDLLIKEVQKLDLAKISGYESPTTFRYSDRTPASQINIYTRKNTYNSNSFDAGNPPKQLEEVFNILTKNIGIPSKKRK